MGWDLAALWSAGRHRFLLNIIDHLPRTSHYQSALANDEELAAQYPQEESTGPVAPPLTDWSPLVERMTLLIDRIGELTAVVASTNSGKKVKPPKPLPRPVTAAEKMRRKSRMDRHKRLVELVKPAPGKQSMADGKADDHSSLIRRRGR